MCPKQRLHIRRLKKHLLVDHRDFPFEAELCCSYLWLHLVNGRNEDSSILIEFIDTLMRKRAIVVMKVIRLMILE